MHTGFKWFLLVIIPLFLLGCGKSQKLKVKPSESDKWELVASFEGHHKKYTDRFQLNGNKALIKYKAESTKNWTYSSLEVYVGKGDENVWENPCVKVFNKSHSEGISAFKKPENSYFLYIKPVEVDYHLKVYQKKVDESAKKQESDQDGDGADSHSGH